MFKGLIMLPNFKGMIPLLITISLIFISSNAFARKWKVIEIPGAKCGAGAPYKVWLDKQDSKKLAIEFMGGGTCWSASTCYGPKLRAWIFPIPPAPILSMFSTRIRDISPAKNHSYLYLPYCTGDVHLGKHTANYFKGRLKVKHHGFTNIQKTFKYLVENKIINFSQINDLLVYGASAGAIGALIHTQTIKPYLNDYMSKTLIADSPGLHFSKNNFWEQFTQEQIKDYSQAMRLLGIERPEEGNISKFIPNICQKLSKWNIGILQGSKDVVTSFIFGKIGPKEHERRVYGKDGV